MLATRFKAVRARLTQIPTHHSIRRPLEGSCNQDSRFYEDSCDLHFEYINSGTNNDNYFRTHWTPSSGRRTNANVSADEELEVIQTILPDVEIFSDSEWDTDIEDICIIRPRSFKALIGFYTVFFKILSIYKI